MPNERYRARHGSIQSDCKCLKTSEGGENDSFAKPLYGLTPVPRVRIPPSPPVPCDLNTQLPIELSNLRFRTLVWFPIGVRLKPPSFVVWFSRFAIAIRECVVPAPHFLAPKPNALVPSSHVAIHRVLGDDSRSRTCSTACRDTEERGTPVRSSAASASASSVPLSQDSASLSR